MGYRGKVWEQVRAREMRASGMLLDEIAIELGVSKASVSTWVRDVAFTPSKRRYGPRVRPNKLMVRKQEEIDSANAHGLTRFSAITEMGYLAAGAALYAGEGGKRDGSVNFANSDPKVMAFFLGWLRFFFDIDESRLKFRLYLHDGLDLDEATKFWADVCAIPPDRHNKPYRAAPDPSIRIAKHPMGCARIDYSCSRTHREVMGLVRALLTCELPFRGSSIGRASDC